MEGDDDARKAVDRIGEIDLEGVEAVKRKDKKKIGALMDEDHSLLNLLGVGHPMLEQLVTASREHSYGAKLTGADRLSESGGR